MQLQWPNYAYIFIAHVNLMLHSGLENFIICARSADVKAEAHKHIPMITSAEG